jgi:hypothetical protein
VNKAELRAGAPIDAEIRAAEHFLRELLSQGRSWPATAVTRQARACGISPAALAQAAERLGAKADCPQHPFGRCLIAGIRTAQGE